MALNYVTLILDGFDGGGNILGHGTATFTPSVQLSDSIDQEWIPPAPVQAAFRAGLSAPQVRLLATDNANVLPAGWGWTVSFQNVPGNPASFNFFLPFSGGATQRLSQLQPVQSVTTMQAYMLLPAGTPAAGQVPVATGTGNAAKWGPGGGVTVMAPAPTGATATDTPNATAAIANLVSALSFGPATLLFEDGTYQVDSNSAVIRSVSNFAVKGTGATVITQAPNTAGKPNNTTGNLLTVADCTDFRVEGLTFDGLRDTLAPMTPLTAAASSGQPSVTVAAGQGANYKTGQNLLLFGGLTSSDQNLSDGYAAGAGTPLVISSITAGGGSGGGDLITFTANLGNSYTQISSTPFTDGFGPYAYAGAYLTPYQAASGNSVAGRTLSGEDQQNGLHLIACQRFTVSRVTARNLWESPVKLGTGFASTSLTDGCKQGTITDCTGYHAYDQGISVWVSDQVTVKGCVLNATGWAGLSLTESNNCAVTGNQIAGPVYRVPNDTSSGYGIAIEGGLHNQVKGNIIKSPYEDGIWLRTSPLGWGLYGSSSCSFSGFLAAQTAAGTSIQVSSTANVQAGGRYSILDGTRTEAVTVATVVDGTHLTFGENIMYSHASGVFLVQRIGQENVIEGNTIFGAQFRHGVHLSQCVRQQITGNVIRNWGLGAASTGSGVVLDYASTNLPSGNFLGGDGSSIDGNVLAGGLGNGVVASATASANLSGLKVRGNDISGLMNAANTAGINLKNVTDSVVQGNKVTDLESGTGIWVQNTNSGPVPARITITGNRVRRCSGAGIQAQTADSLTITGNTVSSCGGHSGISAQGLSRSVIAGNVCNSNQNGGIKLEDNGAAFSLYNRVTGNTCREDGSGINVTTGNAWTQPHGIVEAGTSNNNVFTGNECDANTADQLTTVGAASYVAGNIISGTVTNPPVLTSVAAADASVVVTGGTTPAPSIATGTLDVIAAQHPAAADWSNNSRKITSLASGTAPADAAALGQLPATPGAGMNGLLAWAYDPACGGTASGTIAIGGTLYLTAFNLNSAQTLTNILIYITAAGVTPTAGQSQVGIYNSSGTLVASATAAATAAVMAGTKTQTIPLSSTYAAAAGRYWVGMVFQAATEPTLLRTGTNNGDVANIGLAAAAYRMCVNGTGITTALPASVTPSSNTLTNSINYWAGVS